MSCKEKVCYSAVWQLGCLKGLFGLNLGSSSRWRFFMTRFVFLITNQE